MRDKQAQIAEAFHVEHLPLADLIHQAPAFIAVLHGPKHVFVLANPQYERLVGFRKIIGKPVSEALPELVDQGFIDLLDRVYQTGRLFSATGTVVKLALHENGPMAEHCLDFIYQPMRAADDKIEGIIILGVDVSDRWIAERELRESRAEEKKSLSELDAIYATAPIGLALFDPVEFRYMRLNDRQAEIVGLPKEQVLGKTLTEIAPIDGLREMFEQVARGEAIRNRLLEGELPTRPGEHRYWTVNYDPVFSADGKVEAISAASLEITAQKRAELALIQNEKLAAAGRLAASVAHEINNPLESVTNLLYLIEHGESLNQVREYARSAQVELARVALVTMQTLRFHRQSTAPTHVRVSDVLDSVAMLYEVRLTAAGINVSRRYRDEPIVCLESEVRQVLNNLISNALDATRGGGRLLLRTTMGTEWRTGRRGVRITVADTGHGMSSKTQRRIFEPFFTTKGLTGTGLGLWVSSEILKRHAGSMRVRSSQQEGCHGTVFVVFLPMTYTAASQSST